MPEAILLKDVETLGEKGTVVDVSKGYLRNYLIPRKLAQPATKGAIDAAQQPRGGRGARRAGGRRPRRRAAPSCSTRRSSRSASRPATTAACSARSPPRTSPTRSRRRAASTSTAARSTSRSRSSTSAPTWSSSRSADGVTATVKTMVSRAVARATRHGRAEGLLRAAFFALGRRTARTCDDSAQACEERRRACGEARAADPRRCYVRPHSMSTPPTTNGRASDGAQAPPAGVAPPHSIEAEQSVLGAILLSDARTTRSSSRRG